MASQRQQVLPRRYARRPPKGDRNDANSPIYATRLSRGRRPIGHGRSRQVSDVCSKQYREVLASRGLSPIVDLCGGWTLAIRACPAVSRSCTAARISSGRLRHFEFLLELGADVDDRLVADVEFVGDIGRTACPSAKSDRICSSRGVSSASGFCRAEVCAARPAWRGRRSNRAAGLSTVANALNRSSDDVSLRT